MYQDHNAPPVNPLPKALIVLAIALFAAEPFLMLQKLGFLGGVPGLDGRSALLRDFWLPAELFERMLATGDLSVPHWLRFVSYVFVDGSFTGTAFVLVFVLAMGNFVGRFFTAWKFYLLFFWAAISGALAYALLAMVFGYGGVLVGGMPGAFGLIGAFTWLMWAGYLDHPIGSVSPFALILFLVIFRIATAPVFGWHWGTIANWAGFSTGFGLCFVLIPGGWQHLLNRLRQR